MPTPIPTIGRVVLYRGHDGADRPALVTRIWSEGCINLDVSPNDYNDKDSGVKTSVTQGSDPDGTPLANSWRWMPYQLANPDRGASKP